ncbi:unnamed protein product [Bemisia tabaci]|uniref:Uncharacterized protein n=1 Tax=Bemisia tabaci TaxID=7038 RepID=A0A9P0F367_BEMTA|nr:unnamed protein product [Bemisia tabaci]
MAVAPSPETLGSSPMDCRSQRYCLTSWLHLIQTVSAQHYRFFRVYSKAVQGDGESGPRQIRSTPDWGDTATNGEHLWVPTSASGDFCYVGEGDCTVSTPHASINTHNNAIKTATAPPLPAAQWIQSIGELPQTLENLSAQNVHQSLILLKT